MPCSSHQLEVRPHHSSRERRALVFAVTKVRSIRDGRAGSLHKIASGSSLRLGGSLVQQPPFRANQHQDRNFGQQGGHNLHHAPDAEEGASSQLVGRQLTQSVAHDEL
eukprot:scaffold187036_cov31-Tisochrysis_lutea.AAC.2